MDPYQVYEYCKDENRIFTEVTKNKKNKLEDEEIFNSLLELLEINIEN